MNKLTVKGTQKFMGNVIPVVAGGFGETAKCISDKTVAEIHDITPRDVRKAIIRNEVRFKESVDFIDLKRWESDDHLLKQIGYSNQQILQSEHIYILSERGYAKLIKIMDTDLAWEIHDKLMDEYFQMREERTKEKVYDTKATSLGEVASFTKEMDKRMEKQGSVPWKICEAFKMVSEQFGIKLPDDFVKVPDYEQVKFPWLK